MKTCLALLLFLNLSVSSSRAQAPAQPTQPPKRNITVELQCVSLPQLLALPIIRGLRPYASDEEASTAMATLEKAIDDGSAKLLGWPIVTTTDGEKATHEAAEEISYAKGFESASVGVFLSDKEGSTIEQPQLPTAVEAQAQPIATYFETRHAGLLLEVQPSLTNEENAIKVTYRAEHVRLVAVDRHTLEHQRGEKSEKVIQEQPRFFTLKAESQLTMTSGQPRLIGVYSLLDAAPTLELFILRAEIGKK